MPVPLRSTGRPVFVTTRCKTSLTKICVCVCVCVCVSMCARARARERERERESVCARVCGCVVYSKSLKHVHLQNV